MGEFSVEKKGKNRDDLRKLIDIKDISQVASDNIMRAEKSDVVLNKKGVFALNYKKQFTLDGSLKTKTDPRSGIFAQFYTVADRVSTKGDDFILRGARYLVSVDPTLVVSQKVKIIERDFVDALDAITQVKNDGSAEYFLEFAGVLDYLKNAVITILNASLQEEKLGKFKLGNLEYQRIRAELFELARFSTHAFYSHLIGNEGARDEALSHVVSSYEKMRNACAYILQEYKVGIFSAQYFTRPEASNPLVMMSAAFTSVRTANGNPDTIVGLPSGGTETAFVQQLAFQEIRNVQSEVLLIPLSLHSIKDAFGATSIDESAFMNYLQSKPGGLSGKRILLVEDNSSTGRTIQKMVDFLTQNGALAVEVAVSEADIIRSTIDFDDPKRTHLATRETYNRSVAILPISKKLMPKVDIKELIERRRLIRAHADKKEAQTEVVSAFIENVFATMTADPTEKRLSKLNDMNATLSFRGTFLSNFYACFVEYGGKPYSSVEHAYQAQKFTPTELKRVKKGALDEIHELLRTRGVIRTYKSAMDIFDDPHLASGNVKLIADILRTHGHVRDGWDEMRVPVMANLLLQKYAHPDLLQKLRATGNRYLVEGNTWGDTLWGVSDGKGRNMLGQMLMAIRNEK